MKSIIFNTEMVKAVLDGRKTQFRKVFSKTQLKYFDYAQKIGEITSLDDLHENDFSYILDFSKYKVDDLLYVKETFNLSGVEWGIANPLNIEYRADNTKSSHKWFSSNIMRMEYSRIFLKVTNVRVEKIQDISMQDVLKEGVSMQGNPDRHLLDTKSDWVENWNSTAKDGYKWEDNPYVFAYEFERINKED